MLNREKLLNAYKLMVSAKAMSDTYETNREVCKYVHSTSRGHEAIQVATGLQLLPCDWVSPYYRDDSMMIASGFTPYELMLQLLAKKDDPFPAGVLITVIQAARPKVNRVSYTRAVLQVCRQFLQPVWHRGSSILNNLICLWAAKVTMAKIL